MHLFLPMLVVLGLMWLFVFSGDLILPLFLPKKYNAKDILIGGFIYFIVFIMNIRGI